MGGVIPTNLEDAPPPLCSFCHTSLPVYSPSHKKHTLKRKWDILWGGSLIPNKHKKATTVYPFAAFGHLAVSPPTHT